jgi:hypothetical protein
VKAAFAARHSGAPVNDPRQESTEMAGSPDCGEWFAVIRLTIFGEAGPRNTKPALEGGVGVPTKRRNFIDLTITKFPQISPRVKRKQRFR